MSQEDEEYLAILKEAFKEEATEGIQKSLDILASQEQTLDGLEELYRHAHSLKGASRTVELKKLEELFQEIESFYDILKSKSSPLPNAKREPLTSIYDELSLHFQEYETDIENLGIYQEFLDALKETEENEKPQSKTEPGPKQKPAPKQTLEPTKESVPVTEKKVQKEPATTAKPQSESSDETIKVKLSEVEETIVGIEELVVFKNYFRSLEKKVSLVIDSLTLSQNDAHLNNDEITQLELIEEGLGQGIFEYSTKIDRILNNSRNLLLFPFSNILKSLPQQVRKTARDLNKKADIKIQGDHLRIDRRILEIIKESLIHIIRNSIDHGLEDNIEERVKLGKPEAGQLGIDISQSDGNKIDFVISDDGKGINLEKVKEKAISLGLIQDTIEDLTQEQLTSFIFSSGLSTAEVVSKVSGRGLGMSIIKDRIESIGGEVTVDTIKDQGTKIKFVLPMTISTFRGVVVNSNDHDFIIPSYQVKRIIQVNQSDLIDLAGHLYIEVEGVKYKAISTFSKREKKRLFIILIKTSSSDKALIIDNVIEEIELVLKPTLPPLDQAEEILGTATIENNDVLPVIKVDDYLGDFSASENITDNELSAELEEGQPAKILVVDDSLTSRVLLKNIIDVAGYDVTTAKDGQEAFDKLSTNDFDLIVSDVEMPIVNGFELTKMIRKDSINKDKPIILVTSLSEESHKQKGIESGANAYIVKSSFDKAILLQTIEKFIKNG